MNKRLRKKKHLAEFVEWASSVDINRNCDDGFDEFLDSFISTVEINKCICGFSGCGNVLGSCIVLGRMVDDPHGKLARIKAWLDSRQDVASYKIGPLTDAWHVPY